MPKTPRVRPPLPRPLSETWPPGNSGLAAKVKANLAKLDAYRADKILSGKRTD